jgi:hypothetical protein
LLIVWLDRVGVGIGIDRHERRPILVGTGILDVVRTLVLQDFRQFPAAVEAGDAREVCEQEVGLPRANAMTGGFSGGNLERPGLKQLLADIDDRLDDGLDDGLIDIVVIYKIDRVSRSLMDFAKLIAVFDRNGVTFVSVTQSFNTTTSMGRLEAGAFATIQELAEAVGLAMIAVDGEPEILTFARRMHSKATTKHVFLLLAGWSLLSQNARRDHIEVTRDMDAVVNPADNLLLRHRSEKAEAACDKGHIIGKLAGLADEFEAAAIREVAICVEQACQD